MIEYILGVSLFGSVFVYAGNHIRKKLTKKPTPPDPFLASRQMLEEAGYKLQPITSGFDSTCEFCSEKNVYVQVFQYKVNPRGEKFIRDSDVGSGSACLRCRHINSKLIDGARKQILFEDHIKEYSLNEKQSATPFRD